MGRVEKMGHLIETVMPLLIMCIFMTKVVLIHD